MGRNVATWARERGRPMRGKQRRRSSAVVRLTSANQWSSGGRATTSTAVFAALSQVWQSDSPQRLSKRRLGIPLVVWKKKEMKFNYSGGQKGKGGFWMSNTNSGTGASRHTRAEVEHNHMKRLEDIKKLWETKSACPFHLCCVLFYQYAQSCLYSNNLFLLFSHQNNTSRKASG